MNQHIDTWLSKQLVKCVLYLMQQFIAVKMTSLLLTL